MIEQLIALLPSARRGRAHSVFEITVACSHDDAAGYDAARETFERYGSGAIAYSISDIYEDVTMLRVTFQDAEPLMCFNRLMSSSVGLDPVSACVALLRAINVGGRSALSMADLRRVAESAGFAEPQTLLQSGNLIGLSDATPALLETGLETALAAACGLSTTVFVRSPSSWAALIAGLPFPEFAADDPSHVVAMILRDAPDAARREALQAAITGRERAIVRGTTAYIAYPDGIGRSKLTAARIENALGTSATGRNWRTVEKIAKALARAEAGASGGCGASAGVVSPIDLGA